MGAGGRKDNEVSNTSLLRLPQRLWQNLYWWREDRLVRQRYAGMRHLVYFGGDGIGDELLCSIPLHELRLRGTKNIGILTRRPEFFLHSPDVEGVFPMCHDDLAFIRRAGIQISHTAYIRNQLPPDIDVPPERHIAAEMCRLCGIQGEIALRPYLWLQPEELKAAERYRGCIVMQSSRSGASLSFGNKEWFPQRFQQVANELGKHHRIVQVGLSNEPALEGVDDLRGRLSLRESAALLAQSRAFIGLVGFLMHLARAVDCPSVIVYGGRERPDQSGYPCNENLYTPVACAPCWRWNSCDHERRCMDAITVQSVLDAFLRLKTRNAGESLPAARLSVN